MTATGRASGDGRPSRAISIGAVLDLLRHDFPDISISKIRYLEDQGLVEPQRTPSGYRKFDRSDVERLRYVLGVQRDHYMPLRVIRDHLSALESGLEEPVGRFAPGVGFRGPRLVGPHDPAVGPVDRGSPAAGGPGGGTGSDDRRRFRRGEVLAAAGIDDGLLAALEAHGLVSARPAGHYDADAVAIARTAGELAGFGIEPRHLRAFRTAADREAGLIEQVTSPLRRQRGQESGAHADDVAQELSSLCVRLHASLIKSALDRGPAL